MKLRTLLGALLVAVLVLAPVSEAWAASGSTIVGLWGLNGNHSTKGKYTGSLTITRVSGNNYAAIGEMVFADGTKQNFSGNAVLSRSFWDWFSRKSTLKMTYSLPGAGMLDRLSSGNVGARATIKATYRVDANQRSMSGSWFVAENPSVKGTESLTRRTDLLVTGVSPKSLEQGTENRELRVVGANFPTDLKAGDVSFVAGTGAGAGPAGGVAVNRVVEVADDGTSFKLNVTVAKDAALGVRSVKVKDTTGSNLFTVDAGTIRLKLGGSVTAVAGQWLKLFVPEATGGDLSLTGAAVEVHQGTKEGAAVAATSGTTWTLGEGKAGWYFLKAGAAGNVSASFKQTGEVKGAKKPWNFWYFPFYERGTNMNLYSPNGAYEKIDKVLGLKHDAEGYTKFDKSRHMDEGEFTEPTTDEEKAKYDQTTSKGWAYCYARSTDSKKSWWGHCWGAVVASSLYSQPAAATLKSGDGTADVSFNQEEAEGLLTDYFTNHSVRPTSYVRDCPPGRPTDKLKEDVDDYADDFLLGLQTGIRKNGLPLASNLRAAGTSDDMKDQVWNHVIWKYEARYKEVDGKDDPTFVQVDLDVTATDDVFPSEEYAHRDEAFVLQFKYDESGNLQRDSHEFQNWVSASHFCPSYLWRIESAQPWGTENEVMAKYLDKMETLFKLKKIE
ncbi:MAG: hypothetical protein HYZ53_10705 [Planctomycetes bacterium]|nr:hypothetical protein [Planctomycetota bacterium]